jgi:hypothetical protein
MKHPPSDAMRELERLLAKVRNAGMIALNYDFWERQGAQHASPEERARKAAEAAHAAREHAEAKAALEALVARTRATTPVALAEWADAHDEYLAGFLEDDAARAKVDATGAMIASRERELWAEVRAGTRAFVDENLFYVTDHLARYQRLFGIDRNTLANID